MGDVFYLFLFNAMVQYITKSNQFMRWLLNENISWEHPVEDRNHTDAEMVQLFLHDHGYLYNREERSNEQA